MESACITFSSRVARGFADTKRIRKKTTAEVPASPTPTPVASPTPRKFKLRFPRLFKPKVAVRQSIRREFSACKWKWRWQGQRYARA